MINVSLCLRLATAGFALFVSSCAVYHAPGQTPAPVEDPPDYSVVIPDAPAQRPAAPDSSREDAAEPGAVAAYGPLLERADTAAAKGDYEQALALLERARRIDPDAADIYLALAKTHSARGDFSQARANAERGLLYCNGSRQCGELRNYAQ